MKKLIMLALIASMIAIVFVNYTMAAGYFIKAAEPNKPDANAPKDPNAPKKTSIFTLAAEPNKPDANAPKDPNAPKKTSIFTLAAEPNAAPAPKEGAVTVRGRLIVVKDANGVITSVKVESRGPGGTHNIVLDAKGKELAAKMEGKRVEVTGVESTKNNEKWLTVEKYAEMQRPVPGGPGAPGGPGGGK